MREVAAITMIWLGSLFTGLVDNVSDIFHSTPRPPVIMPIDLTKAGNKVEIKFRITDPSSYYFRLEFRYDISNKLDAKKTRKIVGYNVYSSGGIDLKNLTSYEHAKRDLGDLIDETYNCDGTVIPIDLTVYKIEGDKKVEITQRACPTRGWNTRGGVYKERQKGHISRYVSIIHLDKGKYEAVFVSPQVFPELEGRDIRCESHDLI